MANTIAYTSGNSLTGSLKSGVISINLNDQIIGQNYNWRNGIVFSNQYIIYSDTFTQGIDTEANAKPCAWACDYNDVALLNLINSLPPLIGQPKYDTLASAIAWLQGQNKYFIVNQNYPIIVTDELVFYVDAGLTGSYPIKGTSWYDVSGGGKKATLVNGPAFVNSGSTSYIFFDGTDDITTTDFTQTFSSQITVECTYLGTKTARNHLWGLGNYSSNTNLTADFNDSGLSLWVYWNGGGSPAIRYTSPNFTDGTVKHLVFTHNNTTNKTYLNGDVLTPYDVLGTQSFSPAVGGVMEIGGFLGGLNFGGNIYKFAIYNKELSQAEILQNYYQGPIVTSGLVAAYDAGNIVSYPGTSTTWYDMVGSNNATLLNGITYNLNQGGVLNFDGTDDSASIAYNSALDPTGGITLEAWVKPFNIANSTFVEIYRKETGSARQLFSFQDGGTILSFGTGTAGGYDELDVSINASDYNGQWVHLVASYTSGFKAIYRNGVLIGSATNVTGNLLQSTGTSYIGSDSGGSEFFFGEYAIFRMYNRGLNATEVLQNYSAQRNRFQTNQAFANGGTVSTVIENGINYRVHTFTSSGTLTVLSAGKVEVLAVAGGGGGGRGRGGGGGAGGYIYDTDYSVSTGSKTVTVGAGGAGGTVNSSTAPNGSNSVFDNLTSIGGGGGAGTLAVINSALNGASGGSGGGGSGNSSTPGPGGVGGDGTASQGFKGGTSFSDNASYTAGGGGGGAGGEGNSSVLNNSGNGGVGQQNSISGTASFYAAGGGGGGDGSAIAGSGGSSIGGNGSSSTVGGNATVNTGSGGGGGASSQNGGVGGSGIVIVRYRI
jgi:hypothetical protein